VCLRISAHRAKARDEQAEACEYARRKARNGKKDHGKAVSADGTSVHRAEPANTHGERREMERKTMGKP
ncbi:MAG: hypothetical protein IKI88_03045, partial [Anaerotignum sp.]|nr:hypothetical protein [Anaerotignum sp.]